MLLNATTAISTSKVLLVPYSKWHVPRYHEWMKDEEIQQATASEPLTIEEEYEMQQSWRNDPDKLTFIICLPALSSSSSSSTTTSTTTTPLTDQDDGPSRMIGDINLFLRVDDGEEGDSEDPQIIGEIELMIAEKKDQGQGFGKRALLTFLRYIVEHEQEILGEFLQGDAGKMKKIGGSSGSSMAWKSGSAGGEEEEAGRKGLVQISALSVKIGQTNERSLALFEGLQFRRVGERPNYFGEWELRRTDLMPVSIRGELVGVGIEDYREVPYLRGR